MSHREIIEVFNIDDCDGARLSIARRVPLTVDELLLSQAGERSLGARG